MGKIITYKNEGAAGVFSQVKFNDGKRILISIANYEIKIFKLILRGSIPVSSYWQCDLRIFVDKILEHKIDAHPLDILVEIAKKSDTLEEYLENVGDLIDLLKCSHKTVK
jgi:hypothetical protein